MPFSEDDLRNALKREDPGPAFTQRVMARVNQAESKGMVKEQRGTWFRWPSVLRLRPAMAGALAALVLLIGGAIGYRQYQRTERQRIEEARKAREAERQVFRALRITGTKMNQVLQRVSQSESRETNIRRQTL